MINPSIASSSRPAYAGIQAYYYLTLAQEILWPKCSLALIDGELQVVDDLVIDEAILAQAGI